MVFKALYPSATKFKYIIQTLAKIADEIPFKAEADGLYVRLLSPDKTTMTIAHVPASAFESYMVEEEFVFTIASDEINKVAKRGTRNDLVELIVDRKKNQLEINFIDKKTNVSRRFIIQLRESVYEEFGEPKVELQVQARMMADDFKNILRDSKLVGDEVEFTATPSNLKVQSVAAQKEYKCLLSIGKPLLSLDCSLDSVSAKYSIDLLNAALKAATASDTVTLSFGPNMPMKLVFEMPGEGTLTYWVAPRV